VTTLKALARGDAPLSAALLSERFDELMVKFRQRLDGMVDSVGEDGLVPESFRKFSAELRASSAAAALEALVAVAQAADVVTPTIEVDGQPIRYRGKSCKQWLTPFGIAEVERRYYASDEGDGGVAPLDALCGMTGRFMTPDVEEMVAFASSAMSPGDVEEFLKKTLPVAPSATAIKRAIKDVGGFLEEHKDAVEERVCDEAPLRAKGPTLVASWDGVMVPLRASEETTWKEAAVGRVAVYSEPDRDDGRPRVLDSRCFARMPESGMKTLIGDVAAAVAHATSHQSFAHVVVLCDGKETIWKAAEKCTEVKDATFILDFYHASQSLAGAANAIFGEGTDKAREWHEKHRDRLQLDPDALPKLLRALNRHLDKLAAGSKAHDVVRRAIAHFRTNRRRMKYAEFIAAGLPIGSGHIESAAKFLVTQRMKRSGMRWSWLGGQRILNIRARVKEGRWDAAWGAYLDARAAA
jgi:hypothetical protein